MNAGPPSPPHRPCGLRPGSRVRVIGPVAVGGTAFSPGEVLVFGHEIWDRDIGLDAYVFYPPDSCEREQQLPEIDSPEMIERWLRECPQKVLYGEGKFAHPSAWLRHFELLEEPAP